METSCVAVVALQVDKSIGTDGDFLTEEDFLSGYHHHGGSAHPHSHHGPGHGGHHRHHHMLDMSYDSSVQDIDSISQISAMDSASQTGACGGGSMVDGGGSACCYGASSSRFHMQSKSFSSDSNIHRSVCEQPGSGNCSAGGSGGGPANTNGGIRRGQFPYAYIRSKLSVLPEEQAGQLSRRESMNQADTVDEMSTAKSEIIVGSKGRRSRSTGECVEGVGGATGHADDQEFESGGNHHHPSLRMRKMALRRKRSLSVADIQAPPPAGFEDVSAGGGARSRQNGHVTHFRSEESGYDSDATRKSSPRGSLKHDGLGGSAGSSGGGVAGGVFGVNAGSRSVSGTDLEVSSSSSSSRRGRDDTDSMSSGSDDSGAVSSESKEQNTKPMASQTVPEIDTSTLKKPDIKKPPRKSKLPEATFRPVGSKPVSAALSESSLMSSGSGRRFKKHGETAAEDECNNNSADANALNSLTSKRFKMLRLNKETSSQNGFGGGAGGDTGCGEMGIVISKRRHPQKGTTGYIIAHIEEGGIVER